MVLSIDLADSNLLSINQHEDLSSFNTMGLASRAAALVRYVDSQQLPELTQALKSYGKGFVLGGGSNVILESVVSGLVIKVETQGWQVLSEAGDDVLVQAQAGEDWHRFVELCLDRGYYGLENLALIPGTVGAAPVQNIGAYGVELDQRFHSLQAWDFEQSRMVEMGAADCAFAYRDSMFKRSPPGRWLIVSVRFRLSRAWLPVLDYPALSGHPSLVDRRRATPRAVFEAVCDIRSSKLPDPRALANSGSFFKNPVIDAAQYERLLQAHPDIVAYPQKGGRYKLAAGWLIDRAGWKGRTMGPAGVHDRQALVLVNYGGATANDIRRLSQAIRDDVRSRFGVLLEQEPVAVR